MGSISADLRVYETLAFRVVFDVLREHALLEEEFLKKVTAYSEKHESIRSLLKHGHDVLTKMSRTNSFFHEKGSGAMSAIRTNVCIRFCRATMNIYRLS